MNITMTLVITAIALITRAEAVTTHTVTVGNVAGVQWEVPAEGVGVAFQGGNTVLLAHSTKALSRAHELKKGAAVQLGADVFTVTQLVLVKEKGVPVEQRIQNAQWILPTEDRRMTIVTCAGARDEYRLIVIATL